MKKKLLLTLIMTILGYIVGYFIACLSKNEKILFDVDLLVSQTSLICALVGGGVTFVMLLLKSVDSPSSSSKNPNVVTDSKGNKTEQFYSSRLVTRKELETNARFMFTYYGDLKNHKRDGIPIRAERLKNGKTAINMVKPIHTIVIGTTGSGKTTRLVDPAIQILSETGSKPSIVVSDPKGELYAHNLLKLQKCGYDVQVIDLREPDKSSRWNPLDRAFDCYQRAHNLKSEVKQHISKQDPVSNYPKLLKPQDAKYSDFWYEFNDVAYPNLDILKQDMRALKEKLKDTAMEDVLDVANTLCPISGNDPSWSRGAQGLIQAILIAMLEDSLDPRLGMTKDKYNFYNLAKIAGLRDAPMGGSSQMDQTLESLRNYFKGRPKTSPCVEMANTVVMNAAATSKGFMGHVNGSLKVFSGDMGVCYLTSATDIDLDHFADKPSALFLKIPDEKDTRNSIANMFISQLYKLLIERANENARKNGKEPELPRNVYFLLDEFGNLPKIERLKSFITAGRSRKIFLMLVIQDYTQLNSIYGEQDAQTIRNNCNIHIFLGTKDAKTREEFSKNAGTQAITIESKNKSSSSQSQEYGKTTNNSTSTSYTTQQKPLISAEELDHLDKYQVAINMYGEFTMKTIFTPTYENSTYSLQKPPVAYIQSHYLDQDAVYYDIRKRNDIVLTKEDDDDDDFGSMFKR